MTPREKRAIKTLARGRSRAELLALFALVRRESDEALLAALAPPAGPAPARDALVAEITQLLRPMLAPAAEKGDMLVEHMGALHRNAPVFAAKGLAHAVKGLRARFSDAQIRAAAKSLMAKLAREYGRDSVT